MKNIAIQDYSREKLFNAVVYFVKNTKHCHTLKLYKLLNFLDFEHFRQTGMTVTGMSYQALDHGPVPCEFYSEMENKNSDLYQYISIDNIKDELTNKILVRDIRAKKNFDSEYFTKRELEIMERLAFFFYELKADGMEEFSHIKGLPWRKIYRNGEGLKNIIPYELALNSMAMVKDEPTIPAEELAFVKEAFS